MSFETIGSALAGTLQKLTGPEHSEIVSETDRLVARRWLREHDPETVDRLLLISLQSSLGVEMAPEVQYRYPLTGGYYSVTVGMNLWGNEDNFGAARAKVRLAMEPAEHEQIEEWLALLQAATAGARRSEEGAMVSLALYAGALRRYPADVAKAACERLATTIRWFPVLAEILEMCDRLVSTRANMLGRLERAR